MRPFVIPLSLLLALALLGAGGQSVAKAAVALQTPEPLDTPLPILGEQHAADMAPEVVDEARTAMRTPEPYVLHTPEPLITPPPRPKPKATPKPKAKPHRTALKTPEPVATPLVIALPAGPKSKGVTFTNGQVVYNLVFPLVGAPQPGQDFSVKLINKPNSNQVEVNLSAPKRGTKAQGSQTPTLPAPDLEHGQLSAAPLCGPADIQLQLSAPDTCEVEFCLDDQTVGHDKEGGDGFVLALDTARYTNGLHTLRAVARDNRGAVVQTVEHMVLFEN